MTKYKVILYLPYNNPLNEFYKDFDTLAEAEKAAAQIEKHYAANIPANAGNDCNFYMELLKTHGQGRAEIVKAGFLPETVKTLFFYVPKPNKD